MLTSSHPLPPQLNKTALSTPPSIKKIDQTLNPQSTKSTPKTQKNTIGWATCGLLWRTPWGSHIAQRRYYVQTSDPLSRYYLYTLDPKSWYYLQYSTPQSKYCLFICSPKEFSGEGGREPGSSTLRCVSSRASQPA